MGMNNECVLMRKEEAWGGGRGNESDARLWMERGGGVLVELLLPLRLSLTLSFVFLLALYI